MNFEKLQKLPTHRLQAYYNKYLKPSEDNYIEVDEGWCMCTSDVYCDYCTGRDLEQIEFNELSDKVRQELQSRPFHRRLRKKR